MVKPKPKGSNWELECAKCLSEKSGFEFRRVPLSGAWMGGENQKKNEGVFMGAQQALSGDIIGPQDWPFSVECKNTKDSPRFHLMLGIKGDTKINGYIRQASQDAHGISRIPILFLKRTYRGEYALIPRDLVKKVLDSLDSVPHIVYIYNEKEEKFPIYKNWILLEFSLFLNHLDEFWNEGIEWIEKD